MVSAKGRTRCDEAGQSPKKIDVYSLLTGLAHFQPRDIAWRGTSFIYENPAKSEIHIVRSLQQVMRISIKNKKKKNGRPAG